MKKQNSKSILTIEDLKVKKGFENLPDEELKHALEVMEGLARIYYDMKVVGSFNLELINRKEPYGKS